MTPVITKLYKAKEIGDFGDSWEVTSGTKVDAVNEQLGGILWTPSPESPFEIAIAMRDDVGQVFDPVTLTLDLEADTPEEFEVLYSKDSNGNDWTLDSFNPLQIICYNHDITVAQSFKFFPQPSPLQTWNIRKAGFRVWANISKDPEGRKVMIFELKKVLQYVT